MRNRLSRRRFIQGTSTATGAALSGLWLPKCIRAAEAEWGDLTGRLVYDGTPPERKKLKVDKDVDCCGKFDIRDESLMVGEDGGLANVYIYLRSRRVKVCPELKESVEPQVLLDNRDCIFMPHCLKIWADEQELLIVNSDPVAQNVAFSPLGDVAANIVLPPPPDPAAEATHTFRRRQSIPVPIACNYHPWESAYILPSSTPYVAITGADGTFHIPKLPVDALEFQVWQERVGYLKTPAWSRGRFEVEIKPGTNDLGTITIDPSWLEK